MACDLARSVVHAYLDNELDAVRASEFERHLEQCPECVTALEAQESLSSALHQTQLYEKAPDSLHRKVIANLRPAQPVVMKPRYVSWQWLAAAAAIFLLVFLLWRGQPAFREGNYQAVIASQIVDAHLRALQPGHLTDVVSTDQHTVKPWFDGKVDFSPPVRDFASEGFPLQGGRLDVVHGRTIAALAYGRRKHVISLFIWPANDQDAALHSGSQQGFNWLAWQSGGMEFSAVSDVSSSDLQQLQQLFTR